MTRIRILLVLAVALVATAALAGPASAAASPTLGGVRLLNATANDPQATCLPFGSGFTYTVSGRAVGAYAGTFTETGTVRTTGSSLFSAIVSVDATFTIVSPAGTVTGTRTSVAGGSTGTGGCESGWTNDDARVVASNVRYTATLPDGTTDEGRSSLSFFDTTTIGSYDTTFVSTRPVVVDTDGDGVLDTVDNCLSVPNPGQENLDGDALGDACDPTDDRTPTQKATDLLALVQGVGPGNSLPAKAKQVLAALDAADTAAACAKLDVLLSEVAAQRGKSIPEAKADEIDALAGLIRGDLGC